MNKAAILIISFLLSLVSSAQELADDSWMDQKARFDKYDVQDSVLVAECVYAFTEVDSVLDQGCNHELMLLIGKSYSLTMDYQKYKQDSIFYGHYDEYSIRRALAITDSLRQTYNKYFVQHGDTCYERQWLMFSNMEYEDVVTWPNWTFASDTMRICGYLCHKAVQNFRGRTWTVWYAEDLPFSTGPWKFHGLPGLVLKATDANGLHDFEAVFIRKPKFPVIKRERRWCKVKRKVFREEEYSIAMDMTGEARKAGVESSQTHSSRSFYSPLELE